MKYLIEETEDEVKHDLLDFVSVMNSQYESVNYTLRKRFFIEPQNFCYQISLSANDKNTSNSVL